MADNGQDGGEAVGAPGAGASTAAVDGAVALSPLMARADVAVAAFFGLAAATLAVVMPMLIASGGIETERDFTTLSPALIPRLAFGCLSVLAILAMVSAVRAVRRGTGRIRSDEFVWMRRVGIAALIAIGYAASVTWLGYTLATMVMTGVMAYFLGLRNPIAFVPGVVVVPIVIHFVFERLLLISLPRSSIESIGLVEDALMRGLVQIFIP